MQVTETFSLSTEHAEYRTVVAVVYPKSPQGDAL